LEEFIYSISSQLLSETNVNKILGYLEDSKVAFLEVIASITALAGVFLVLQPTKVSTSLSAEPYVYHKGIVSGIVGVAGGVVSFSQI